jgi:hypothetical protein
MTELGIPVFNTPGANANAVKELVLCGMLLGSRKIVDGINHMKDLGAQGLARERVEKDKAMFGGQEIKGKTLAVMEVSGGSQSFNAVNQMRILGRWMRMLTIPNQSSVAKAFLEFEEDGRMKPSAYFDRVVDVMEELVKFTLLTRDVAPYLVDRYSERKETAEQLSKRVNHKAL